MRAAGAAADEIGHPPHDLHVLRDLQPPLREAPLDLVGPARASHANRDVNTVRQHMIVALGIGDLVGMLLVLFILAGDILRALEEGGERRCAVARESESAIGVDLLRDRDPVRR
eukprot:14139182-Heterocapsa_arctica.AAC.1